MPEYDVMWVVIAVIFGVTEGATVNLVTIWFALGAVGAFVTSLFTDSLLIQICVFVSVSVLTLILTRPFVKKYLNNRTVATNADRYINQIAGVIENIDSISGSGKVKTMGQVWSAKSEDGQVINAGEEVIINRIEGVRVVVSKID